MLVSLEQWRDQEVGARAVALLSETSALLDQCALNVVLENAWTALHPTWNVQSYHLTGDDCLAFAGDGRDRIDEALADPAIVHFTGGSFNRPWQAPCRNPYRDEWFECLDRSAWRGWRPKPAPPLARAWGGTKRAARVLRHGGGTEARGSAGVA
jgi:lipopolysaccharide biosynthesis glycosyltransferase